MADKSASNLLAAIARAKNPPLDRLIFALGIRHVGEQTAKRLAAHLWHPRRPGGRHSRRAANHPGHRPRGRREHRRLLPGTGKPPCYRKAPQSGRDRCVPRETARPQAAPLAGKSFVFTGTLARMGRSEAKALVESLGGTVASSVTKTTDYVVAGEAAGSKLEKARQAGIAILDEEAFFALTRGRRRMNKRYHVRISGRVQGVFFRANTWKTGAFAGTDRLGPEPPGRPRGGGLRGGEKAAEAMLAWCRTGTPPARVDHLEVAEESATGGFTDFD